MINSVRWPKDATEYMIDRSMVASVLPHFRNIIANGVAGACARDGILRRSLTAYRGYLTHEETSGIQDRPWITPEKILKLEGQPLDPAPKTTVTRSVNYYEDVQITL